MQQQRLVIQTKVFGSHGETAIKPTRKLLKLKHPLTLSIPTKLAITPTGLSELANNIYRLYYGAHPISEKQIFKILMMFHSSLKHPVIEFTITDL